MTAAHVKFTDTQGVAHVERWERVRIDGQRVYVGDLKDADLRWHEVSPEERDRLAAVLTGEEPGSTRCDKCCGYGFVVDGPGVAGPRWYVCACRKPPDPPAPEQTPQEVP